MTQQPILTVGSLNMDQIVRVERLPMMGETLLGAGSLRLGPGRKGANQAVAMAPPGPAVSSARPRGHAPFAASLPTGRALVLQLEIPLETVKTLISAGHQAGVPVVLNLAPAQALPLEILRQVDVLVVNETEASFLRDTLVGAQMPGSVIQTLT